MNQSGVQLDRKKIDFVQGSLRPLGDRIIVRPLPLALSQMILAAWNGRTVRGEVLAIGPGEYPNIYNADRSTVRKSKRFRPTEIEPGQIVHLGGLDIGGYAFPRVQMNGEEVIICSEKDVCGVE